MSHAFSDQAIKSMEKYILANIRSFCSALRNGTNIEKASKTAWSSPKNMSDWCNYLTFDVLGDLCFGISFEMLEHENNRHVVDLVSSAARMHLIVSTSIFLGSYLQISSPSFNKKESFYFIY
jgi:hypothetical protein